MPLPTFKSRLLDDLHEAQTNGCPLVCKACREVFPPCDAVTGPDTDEAFCSQSCCDRYEDEYHQYIEREMARAAQAFRNRTPEQARRVSEWNVFADQVNERTANA